MAAVPFSDYRPIRREVSRAARCRRCFRDIKTAAAICAEICEACEAALGYVVIEPVLATTLRTVCSFQYPIGQESFDLLRACFIHEQLAG